jgi:glucose-1-phosphate cytidylyltransferase
VKTVILAGGLGTRISEESHLKPKPMIEIGDYPILWHIMKIYSKYNMNDFVVCLGYKSKIIKEYFAHYFMYQSDVTFDFRCNSQQIVHNHTCEPWCVTLVNTGLNTMTGGRVKRIQKYVGNETFMLTYGDGVGDVNITALLEFHKKHGKLATVTATQPSGRYGALDLDKSDQVLGFQEKPKGDNAWINAGFFVMEPGVFDYIDGDDTILERAPLENLAKNGQLIAYKHEGYWQPMDTMRDKIALENLWNSGKAPWKVWEN